MNSHKKCVHCRQRKDRDEQTVECPARPEYGHEWKEYPGNGITWSESGLVKLTKWSFRNWKIAVPLFIGIFIYFKWFYVSTPLFPKVDANSLVIDSTSKIAHRADTIKASQPQISNEVKVHKDSVKVAEIAVTKSDSTMRRKDSIQK